MKTLILGASYGSLLSTKLLMAGHDATLICREETAKLINSEGTVVRIKLRDEDEHRSIASSDLPGHVDAAIPQSVNPSDYDLVCLAMQEPQYSAGPVKELMARIAEARVPCLSIMNMPPLPYLRRIDSLKSADLDNSYDNPSVWSAFEPGLVSLCSPDPQAFRPPEEKANVLHVGLPTNFKAAVFASKEHNEMLRKLESDMAAVTLDGKDVPVKLKVFDSLFVPMAKWSMLLTGNYRCVQQNSVIPIQQAVHGDINESEKMYHWVDELARALGADAADQVPFEKYANAAKNLMKPSSVARAIDAGSDKVERVDRLVQSVGKSLGMQSDTVDAIVATVDARLKSNQNS
ncbi:MAG: ketopantoate reductase family protein [Granulosicoccus sp.]